MEKHAPFLIYESSIDGPTGEEFARKSHLPGTR